MATARAQLSFYSLRNSRTNHIYVNQTLYIFPGHFIYTFLLGRVLARLVPDYAQEPDTQKLDNDAVEQKNDESRTKTKLQWLKSPAFLKVHNTLYQLNEEPDAQRILLDFARFFYRTSDGLNGEGCHCLQCNF
jgi:hypothetical protein